MNHVLIGFPLLIPKKVASSMPARTKFQSTLVSLDDNRITCPEGGGGSTMWARGSGKDPRSYTESGNFNKKREQ